MAVDSFNIDKLIRRILAVCRLSHGEILAIRQQTRRPMRTQRLPSLIIPRIHISPDPSIRIRITPQLGIPI